MITMWHEAGSRQPLKNPSLRNEGRLTAALLGPGRESLGLWELRGGPWNLQRGLGHGGWERESRGLSVEIKHRGVEGRDVWEVCWRKVTLATVQLWEDR